MADRIMIFNNNLGVLWLVDVNMPHRRDTAPNFRAYVDEVYMQIANSDVTKQAEGARFKTLGSITAYHKSTSLADYWIRSLMTH